MIKSRKSEKKLDFQKIKDLFNNITLIKGQYVSIATCDSDGNPNVAPIGSMRIVDENKIHVLQGFLPKTYENLTKNQKAVFQTCTRLGILSAIKLSKGKLREPLGYRIYCKFINIEESIEKLRQECNQLVIRFPYLLRGLALKFLQNSIRRLLIFKIVDIREISPQVR